MFKKTILLTAALLCAGWALCRGEDWTDAQIVNAIYWAEGGPKADYLYGIRSVEYDNAAEARRICFNTVRNNRRRFTAQTEYNDFINFLASRYCPVGAGNDPKGVNINWIKNVRYYLDNPKPIAEKGGDCQCL